MACALATNLDALPANAALAVGSFDGLHLGHQALLREMLAYARATGRAACVLTFGQSPLALLDPAHDPGRIVDDARNGELLRQALSGSDALLIQQSFTPAFAALPAEDFIRRLRAATLFCGEDWRFGTGASGTPETARAAGLEVHIVPYAQWQGERVSSTRIRAALQAGDLAAASAMLGRAWDFCGTVVRGRGLAGPSLGFPTLNLPYRGRTGERLTCPARGVYAAQAKVGSETRPALVNFGVAPTLKAEAEPLFEAHLPGWSGEAYGREVTLTFTRPRLRPERAFASLAELQVQITDDLTHLSEALHG